MSKGKKILNKRRNILLILVMATFLMGIGYASVNSVILNVNGDVMAIVPGDGLLITDVDYSDGNYIEPDESEIIKVYKNLLNNKVVLSKNVDSSITYTITVHNYTNEDYTFIDTLYYNDFYDNEDIVFELSNLEYGDVIKSKKSLEFDITFKYKEGVDVNNVSNILNSYLNFRFLRVVKYIEGTGTQYIDTGIKADNTTTFNMSFSFTDLNRAQAIFGSRQSMGQISHNVFYYYISEKEYLGGELQLRWDENYDLTYIDLNYNVGSKISISKTLDELTVSTNGSGVVLPVSELELSIDKSMFVFNINQEGAPETRYAYMKLYDLEIYQSGEIVRDYIPVLDDNGRACLYDLVENKYYYNELSDDFEYGYYEAVNYLEGTGTQYIDTNYYANNLTNIEMIMSISDANSTQPIFGSRNGQMDKTYNMFLYRGNLRWDYLYDTYNMTHTSILTEPMLIEINNNTVNVDETLAFEYGVTVANQKYEDIVVPDDNFTHENFRTGYSMYLFSVNNAGSAFVPQAGMKIYYFKIIENEIVVMNLVPVIDKDGIACLYDTINDLVYYNASGNGYFAYN